MVTIKINRQPLKKGRFVSGQFTSTIFAAILSLYGRRHEQFTDNTSNVRPHPVDDGLVAKVKAIAVVIV